MNPCNAATSCFSTLVLLFFTKNRYEDSPSNTMAAARQNDTEFHKTCLGNLGKADSIFCHKFSGGVCASKPSRFLLMNSFNESFFIGCLLPEFPLISFSSD